MKTASWACIFLAAASPARSANEALPAPAHLTLKTAPVIEVAPQQSARYTLRARFAPAESAGELREGAHFTLIGRFAKGGVSCGIGGVIFSNGFEGN